MPGAWKKTLSYLGLVEEEEEDDDIQDLPEEQSMASHPASRRFGREPVSVAPSPEPAHSVIRTIPSPAPPRRSTRPSRSGSTRPATWATSSARGSP